MAKDVITRFKLETTQYDSKLRDASKGLADYAKTATAAGKEFDKFTKANVDAAKALGNITPSANNAKDKVKELVTAYNDLAKAYNALTKEQQSSDFGKAMAESLGKLKTQIADAKQELYGMGDAMKKAGEGSSGFTSMLAVFGGNLLTKGVSMLTSELVGSVRQSIELAKQGEGIRIAFERLGRGDILDGLRQATHGTVADIELMKAAVKFNDFKLPLDQLGTMLAFAQQKAKDTGQSVDYMVDSIVTGLGRKSLMILDNLGLSATQIKERMAETGDMTKAVGDIIREEMSKSGDYIETAAERATQADVQLQNAMENLGRTLLPLQEQGEGMWKSLETGAINLLNEGLTPMVPKVIELKNEIGELYDTISGSSVFSGLVDWMETGIDTASVFIPKLRLIRELLDFGKGNAAGAGAGIGGIIANIPDQTINEIPEVEVIGHKSTRTRTGSRTSRKQSTADMLLSTFNKANGKIDAASLMDTTTTGGSELFRMLQAQHQQELKNIPRDSRADFEAGQQRAKNEIEKGNESTLSYAKKQLAVADTMAGNLGNILSGLTKMGIELPEGLSAIVEGTQSIISIVTSIMTLVSIISTLTAVKSTPIFGWLLAGGGVAGGSRGRGVIHAAMGTVVPGNTYSGDQIPALLNAGEVVLNRSQVSTLASSLQGTGMQNMNLQAIVTGEQLRFILNTNSRRRGKGEYVTSTHQ